MTLTKSENAFIQKFINWEVRFRSDQVRAQQRRQANGGEGSDLAALKDEIEEKSWQLEVLKKLQQLCEEQTR